MATILAHIVVKPGREADFEHMATRLYQATHAQEADVRRYEYWRGEAVGSYYALLSFDDYDAFLVHQTSDHHESVGPLQREVMESIHLEWVDPMATASRLAPTDAQPIRPDADELWSRYHEKYAPVIQDWWLSVR